MGQPLLPDVPNWSSHEYGMRAGFRRQFKALTDRKIPVTLALNANVCNTYPRVASAALEAGLNSWNTDSSRARCPSSTIRPTRSSERSSPSPNSQASRRGRGRVRALQRPRRPMISCGRFRYEFAAAIVGRDAPLLGAGPLELTFPDHEEFLPSPAKNRPKPPCANNSGSRRL
jgi:hypothetical protein